MDDGQRTNLNQKKWNLVPYKMGLFIFGKIDDDASVTSSFWKLVA